LLLGEIHSRSLCVELEPQAPRVFRAEALLEEPRPQTAACPEFRHFFEEADTRIEKEGEAVNEIVHVHAAAAAEVHVPEGG